MIISQVYKNYKIMPNLAEHQLKVAGVAKVVIDNLSLTLDRKEIITACLLHDMGNIIKFDLSQSRNLLNADLDMSFWQKVKDEYLSKYGPDEHTATLKIAEELKVSGRVLELIDSVGFSTAEKNLQSEDWSRKICAYADMRVKPQGVVSLEERLQDLRVRYESKARQLGSVDKREVFENSLREIEKQIFDKCKITPEAINEFTIKNLIEELNNFEL